MQKLTDEQKLLVEQNHDLIYWFINKKGLPLNEYYDLFAIVLCETAMKYDPSKGKFSTLFTLKANNRFINEYRKKTRLKSIPEEVELLDYMVEGETYEELELAFEAMKVDVPDEYHKLMEMRFHGYTRQEIHDELGIGKHNIVKTLKEARKYI